jgi:hypothetical protein
VVPVPDPVLDPLLPEPMLPEPVLGAVLGAVLGVLLGEVVALPLLLPEAPVPAPELDLLKWASHSARDTWPSLLVSTAEKLGAIVLLALPDMPPLDDEDEVPALPPDAAGDDEDEDLSLLVPDDELCATATPESAKSAAVAALSSLIRDIR